MVVAQLLRSEELEEVALHVRLHEVQILKHNTKEGMGKGNEVEGQITAGLPQESWH